MSVNISKCERLPVCVIILLLSLPLYSQEVESGKYFLPTDQYKFLTDLEAPNLSKEITYNIGWINVSQFIKKNGKPFGDPTVTFDGVLVETRKKFHSGPIIPEVTIKSSDIFAKQTEYYRNRIEREENPADREHYRKMYSASLATEESVLAMEHAMERSLSTLELVYSVHQAIAQSSLIIADKVIKKRINQGIDWALGGARRDEIDTARNTLYLVYHEIYEAHKEIAFHRYSVEATLKYEDEAISVGTYYMPVWFLRNQKAASNIPDGFTNEIIDLSEYTNIGSHPTWSILALMTRKILYDLSLLEENLTDILSE